MKRWKKVLIGIVSAATPLVGERYRVDGEVPQRAWWEEVGNR
jgi:hypothetical protein